MEFKERLIHPTETGQPPKLKILRMKSGILLCLVGLLSSSFAAHSRVDTLQASKQASKRVIVLDLVDLSENQPKPDLSEILRKDLQANGTWSLYSRDSVVKRMGEFNMNSRQGCNNPQCSFDIGNIAQAEFVLYGTVATIGFNQLLTLKLLHIPTAKIVWTKVLEVNGNSEIERIHYVERLFGTAVSEMVSVTPDKDKSKHGFSLAVIDVSENSLTAKALQERISSRVYGNPTFEPMSPNELAELLSALEINKFSVIPSVENMVGLGQKLGVSHLLYSRLYRDGNSYIYRLAVYDVNKKAVALEMPPQPSDDLLKLLDYEKTFFNTLFSKTKEDPKPMQSAKLEDGGKSHKALWISLGVLGLGGGVAAYWVESLKSSGGNTTDPTSTISPPLKPPLDQNQ